MKRRIESAIWKARQQETHNQNGKKNKIQRVEDGSEVGGGRTHLLEHPGGTPAPSSEEQSEETTEPQLI